MGRRKRSYAPGTIFHLVSRVHRSRRLFAPAIRSQIVQLIRRSMERTDAGLIAYAVMPNHLHLMLRQGRAELAAVMQPLLRSVAHRVQKHHDIGGTVVERRYRDRACGSAEHLRQAVAYIHLNPWRAGLCRDDLAYPWSSHVAYLPDADPLNFGIDPGLQQRVLHLFSGESHTDRDGGCHDYLRWVRWRMRRDADIENGPAGDAGSGPPPHTRAGDEVWLRYFIRLDPSDDHGGRSLPDLRDFILVELARIAPNVTVDQLRGSWRPRELGRIRSKLIRSAGDRGFRTVSIAAFFEFSPQSVSRIRHLR